MNTAKPYLIKIITSLFFLVIGITFCHAQTDTIVVNNQKTACTVKEITPDAVKYTYPGEDVLNSVYKNTVQKIIFKSGRIQTFAESTSYKKVSNVMDFDNVTITAVESEVHGLFKISDVGAKAKGTTVYSSMERVKERAYHKLKLQASMFGANIIYLSDQKSEGNKYGGYWGGSSTTETNLTGIAYSNVLPDYDEFKKVIGNKTNFIAVKRFELGSSDTDVSQDDINKPFTITNITNESGLILIAGNLKDEKNVFNFQVANFTNDSFSIAYRYKGTVYNFTINM